MQKVKIRRWIKVKEEIHVMGIPGGHEWWPPADGLDEFSQYESLAFNTLQRRLKHTWRSRLKSSFHFLANLVLVCCFVGTFLQWCFIVCSAGEGFVFQMIPVTALRQTVEVNPPCTCGKKKYNFEIPSVLKCQFMFLVSSCCSCVCLILTKLCVLHHIYCVFYCLPLLSLFKTITASFIFMQINEKWDSAVRTWPAHPALCPLTRSRSRPGCRVNCMFSCLRFPISHMLIRLTLSGGSATHGFTPLLLLGWDVISVWLSYSTFSNVVNLQPAR